MNKNFKMLIATLLAALSGPVVAGMPNSVFAVPHSIPAVSQAGLIALAFAVGIIGAVLINKYKPHKH